MKVQSEKLPGSLARLEIEIEDERVGKEMERAYRRLANRVAVPGFRRGKAPRVLVERMLGEGALLEEAAKELVPDAITDALQQESLEPVAEPESYNQLETTPFRFEVTVPVVPTVTLGEYREVRAERQPIEVSDDEVEEVIQQLRERDAKWVTPEPLRPTADGDQLVVDIGDFVEGEPLAEPQEDVTLVLGSGSLLPELETQMVGAEEGQEYEYSVTLPEDHERADIAGKPATFKVRVKRIQERRLPELDDEFAHGVGADLETVDDLRRTVRENLEARKSSEERDRLVSAVVDQMVIQATVDLPEALVTREATHRLRHLASEFEAQGITFEQFLSLTGRAAEDLLNELREPARDRVIRGLVLSEIAKAEQIEVTDADIEAQAAQLMDGIEETELENVRQMLASESWQQRLRSEAFDRKVLNRVVEIATGETLDAPITAAEDELMQESDFEINDALNELEARSSVAEATEESEEAVAASSPATQAPEEGLESSNEGEQSQVAP